MRRATFKELGIRWHYWLIVFTFAVAGIVALVAITFEPEDRGLLLVCGAFFLIVASLALLWPLLRVREPQGVRFGSVRVDATQHVGVIFPTSKVKKRITLCGATIFGLVGLWGLFNADSVEIRVKGGVAFALYAGFLILCFRHGLAWQSGITLTKEGIVWGELMMKPCFVPWTQIAAAKVYAHKEKYSTSPTFGLLIDDLSKVEISTSARRKFQSNVRSSGWHLYFHGETLLVPLPVVESTINFYLHHPVERGELPTGAALERIVKMDGIGAQPTLSPR
jgi:hypothetical protein